MSVQHLRMGGLTLNVMMWGFLFKWAITQLTHLYL